MRGTLPIAITFTFTSALGRGQLGQKVAKNVFSWHPSGEHLVYGLFERYIGILLPKKVPNCQILRKRVICDHLLLNCITAKKFEILNSTITKTTCIMIKSPKPQKTTCKIFKPFFFISQIVFELYDVKHPFLS